jgi:hypothetical protein
VYSFADTAIKHTETDIIKEATKLTGKEEPSSSDIAETWQSMAGFYAHYVRLGKVAMKNGIHIAPHVGFALKQNGNMTEIFEFMLRIVGDTIKGPKGFEALKTLGRDGMENFFCDYVMAHKIGFEVDNNRMADNYSIADGKVHMFDLHLSEPRKGVSIDKLLCGALDALFEYWHDSMTIVSKGQTKKGRQELALSKIQIEPMKKKEYKALVDTFRHLVGDAEAGLKNMGEKPETSKKLKTLFACEFDDSLAGLFGTRTL